MTMCSSTYLTGFSLDVFSLQIMQIRLILIKKKKKIIIESVYLETIDPNESNWI